MPPRTLLPPAALLLVLLPACGSAPPRPHALSEEDVGLLGATAPRSTRAGAPRASARPATGAAALTASVDTRPVTWSDAAIGAALEPLRAPIAACAAERRSFTLRLRFDPTGVLASGSARDLDPTEGACVGDVLRGLRIDGRVRHPREVTLRVERPATARAAPADVAPAVRAFLDAQRDVILACAARAIVPIEVRWDGRGGSAFVLRGLEGTDEERCATAALATAPGRPSLAGAAGSLVHAVR